MSGHSAIPQMCGKMHRIELLYGYFFLLRDKVRHRIFILLQEKICPRIFIFRRENFCCRGIG